MRLSALVADLELYSDPVTEHKVVQKFLRVVPRRYRPMAMAIESLIDLKTMSIEELVGRLSACEDHYDLDNGSQSTGRLLLTHEEWMAWERLGGGGSSTGGGGSSTGGAAVAARTNLPRSLNLKAVERARQGTPGQEAPLDHEARRKRGSAITAASQGTGRKNAARGTGSRSRRASRSRQTWPWPTPSMIMVSTWSSPSPMMLHTSSHPRRYTSTKRRSCPFPRRTVCGSLTPGLAVT